MLNKLERVYLLTGLLLLVAFVIIEAVNGRLWMNDLRVYYTAAEAFVAGNPVYGEAFGLQSGYFKYAPASLYLFLVFTLFDFETLRFIHFLSIGISALLGLLLVKHVVYRTGRFAVKPMFFLLICTLVVAVHWHRELHLGNLNLPILLLLLFALVFALERRWVSLGFCLSVVLLVKPHFLLLLPLLLWYGRVKEVSATVVLSVVLVASTLLVFGVAQSKALHTVWLQTMNDHNAALIYSGGDAREALNTIYTLCYSYLLQYILPTASQAIAYVLFGIIGGLTFLFLLWEKAQLKNATAEGMIFMWIWALALVPSITLTDTNHFLFSLPLIAWLLVRWQHLGLALKVIFVIALFCYGGNWADALGPVSDWMRDMSLVGLGNVVLLLMGIVLRIQEIRRSQALLY